MKKAKKVATTQISSTQLVVAEWHAASMEYYNSLRRLEQAGAAVNAAFHPSKNS